jgi:hypothetical protein
MGGVEAKSETVRARSGVLALASLAAALVLTVALAWLNVITHSSWSGVWGSIVIALPFVVVGTAVAWRQPGNPLGWILIAIILLFLASDDAGLYGQLVYQHGHRGWPAGPVALFLEPLWFPGLVLLPPVAILVFPSGRLHSRVLRLMLGAYVAVSVIYMLCEWAIVAGAVIDRNIHLVPDGDLTVIDTPPAWFHVVQGVSLAVVGVCVVGWIGVQVTRWRRATGEHRQQVKWLMCGAAFAVTCLGVMLFAPRSSYAPVRAVVSVLPAGLAALPASIAVGILRYRLYEIDVIIRKTLTYAVLAGSLAVVYLGGISLIDRALQAVTGQSGALAVTASTLAVAAAFQPLRTRIQRGVEHRFYRAKYDATQTLQALTGRLRDQIELDALAADVLGIVRLTLQPSHASLWLRPAQPRQGEPAPSPAAPRPPG